MRKIRRGKWLGRDGCRVRGAQFGGLAHVPVDSRVDAKPYTCFNCRLPGHRMAECGQPRNQLVCFNCGRLEVTIRSCPRCGPAHSALLAERKQTAATAAAQTREACAGANSPRAMEIATLSVTSAKTASAEAPANRRKKCRRAKKKRKSQQTAAVQVPSTSQQPAALLPASAEPQPSTSQGTTSTSSGFARA